MTAEVISFKTKDTSVQDKEVINTFVEAISPSESYSFFYLDTTRSTINTTLEIQKWDKAIADLKFEITESLNKSDSKNIKEFADMCRALETLMCGGIIGVGFDTYTSAGVNKWTFMLCKVHDDKYIIRDLMKNANRVIVRG